MGSSVSSKSLTATGDSLNTGAFPNEDILILPFASVTPRIAPCVVTMDARIDAKRDTMASTGVNAPGMFRMIVVTPFTVSAD